MAKEPEAAALFGDDSLSALPRGQRLQIARKHRREQLQKYYENENLDPQSGLHRKNKNPNSKGAHVNFNLAEQLRDAVTRFDVKEVFSLLDHGADPNTTSECGVSLLHQCCVDDNLRIAEILVQRGAEVNCADDELWTPLHTACACEYPEIVQLLLNNGADVTRLDVDGMLPMDLAPRGTEARMVIENHMQNLGYDNLALRNIKQREALRMLAEVKDFLNSGGDHNVVNEEGISLLHIAAANNYQDVVKLLISKSADIDGTDSDGYTALHLASKFGHRKMVKLLLRFNANPHVKNLKDETPSDVASSYMIDGLIKTSMGTYDISRKGSIMRDDEEVDNGFDEEVTEFTSHRLSKSNMSKSEALFEAETRLPPEGKEDEDLIPTEVPRDLPVLHAVPDDAKVYWPAATSTDNLAGLPELTDNIILQELMTRYSKDLVYTYVGDLLIAVNPFKAVPIYSKSASDKFMNIQDRSSLTPHVFAIADIAYQALLCEKKPQCCIISGESGAGKTETAKYLVQHLLTRASSKENMLNDKIQQVNPLLEVFGNAQTIMNDNSSRFGKFIELIFLEDGTVAGAKFSEYLLEKSRVVRQAEGERNYHIFYLLFNGLSRSEKEEMGLQDVQHHRYLKNGDMSKLNTEEVSANRFRALQNCMKLVGFSEENEEKLIHVLAVVLLLGDLKFSFGNLNHDGAADTVFIKEEAKATLEKISSLLQVSPEDLGESIVSESTIMRGESIKKYRTKIQAIECRDAFAKALYSRLFSWVVNNINQHLEPINQEAKTIEICVLDIFGFENLITNSFEQICINLANEKIQGFFNEHIFEREKLDYEEEGLDTSLLTFTSNAEIIELFQEKHKGIMDLLDEESHFPRASDQSLANKLHAGPGKKNKKVYITPRDGGLSFSIFHYAGTVKYSLDGILEKNRDTLAKSVDFTMKTSLCPLVRDLFKNRLKRTGSLAPSIKQSERRRPSHKKNPFDFFRENRKSARETRKRRIAAPSRNVSGNKNVSARRGPATLAFHFKNSLADLMEKIQSSAPHFIRCIKPNTAKLPDKFTPEYIMAQLRYTGILETTKIRRDGYPLRLTSEDFMNRYSLMIFTTPHHFSSTVQQKCDAALHYYKISGYKIGKTKMFFRHWHLEQLSGITLALTRKLVLCQKVVRGHLCRKNINKAMDRYREEKRLIARFLETIEPIGGSVWQAQKDSADHDEETHLQEEFNQVVSQEEQKLAEEAKLAADQSEQFDLALKEPPIESNTLEDGTEAENSVFPDPPPELSSVKEGDIETTSSLSNSDLELPRQNTPSTFPEESDSVSVENVPPEGSLGGSEQSLEVVTPIHEGNGEVGYVVMQDLLKTVTTNLQKNSQSADLEANGYESMNSYYREGLPPPPPLASEDLPPPPIEHTGEMPVTGDLPPPPPVADVDTAKIAGIRNKFLQDEKRNIEKQDIHANKNVRSPKKIVHPFEVQSWTNSVDGEGGSPQKFNGRAESVKRRPPAAPHRDPSTRLSTASGTSKGPNDYEHFTDGYFDVNDIPAPPPGPAPQPPYDPTYSSFITYQNDPYNVPPPPDMLPPAPPPPSQPPPPPPPPGPSIPPPLPPNHPGGFVPPPPPPPGLNISAGGFQGGLRKTPRERPDRPAPAQLNPIDMIMEEIKQKAAKRISTVGEGGEFTVPKQPLSPIRSPPPVSPKPVSQSGGTFPPPVHPKPGKQNGGPPGKTNGGPRPNAGIKQEPINRNGDSGDTVPGWKKDILNKKKMEEQKKLDEEERKKTEEEAKWAGIPEWKKKIILEKQKKKVEEDAIIAEEKKETLKHEEIMKDMPPWKRKLYRKKNGLPEVPEDEGIVT